MIYGLVAQPVLPVQDRHDELLMNRLVLRTGEVRAECLNLFLCLESLEGVNFVVVRCNGCFRLGSRVPFRALCFRQGDGLHNRHYVPGFEDGKSF